MYKGTEYFPYCQGNFSFYIVVSYEVANCAQWFSVVSNSLLYGSGLRIEELLNLKTKNIDSERMLVHVKNAKGNKDRYTILSYKSLDLLRIYYKEHKPKEYLFEGQKGGKYSSESAGQLFKRALKRAKIDKNATLHTLRHSFATHLLEDCPSLM